MAEAHLFRGNLTVVPVPERKEAVRAKAALAEMGVVPRRSRSQAIRENRAVREAWAAGRIWREAEAPLELRERPDGGAVLWLAAWDSAKGDVAHRKWETFETAAEVAAFKAGFHLEPCPVRLPRKRKEKSNG